MRSKKLTNISLTGVILAILILSSSGCLSWTAWRDINSASSIVNMTTTTATTAARLYGATKGVKWQPIDQIGEYSLMKYNLPLSADSYAVFRNYQKITPNLGLEEAFKAFGRLAKAQNN
jgi:hypothetical protein